MFDSEILDIFIGLAAVYFLMSLLVTIVGEYISRALALRSKNLHSGIEELFGDAKTFYEHDLVKGTFKGAYDSSGVNKLLGKTNLPSYISSQSIAAILLDEESRKNLNDKAQNIYNTFNNATRGYGEQQLQKLQAHLEKWFDDSMKRVDGWYKRKMQLIAIILAFVLTVLFNVDTIAIANRLSEDDALRAGMVSLAENSVENFKLDVSQEPATTQVTDAAQVPKQTLTDEQVEKLRESIDQVTLLGLPLGWTGEFTPDDFVGWLGKLAGLVVTGFLVSLGAPFWYDLLNKLANIRSSGAKPSSMADNPDQTKQ